MYYDLELPGGMKIRCTAVGLLGAGAIQRDEGNLYPIVIQVGEELPAINKEGLCGLAFSREDIIGIILAVLHVLAKEGDARAAHLLHMVDKSLLDVVAPSTN